MASPAGAGANAQAAGTIHKVPKMVIGEKIFFNLVFKTFRVDAGPISTVDAVVVANILHLVPR